MTEPATKKAKVSKPVLYSYWRSSCSWRVRVALNMKKIRYEYVAKHLVKAEQLSSEYAEKNPSRELPTLEIDGLCLNQSMAIIQYLDETRSGGELPSLFPSTPEGRYQVRRICDIIGTGIQPIQNLRVLLKVMQFKEDKDEKTKAKIAWGKHWIDLGFQSLEKALSQTAGKYCVGDSVTAADLFLVPQVYNANRFKVDMSKFPIISRIDKALNELEDFKNAHPSQMPDAQ
jgi:maleylacetoacetate isomerase